MVALLKGREALHIATEPAMSSTVPLWYSTHMGIVMMCANWCLCDLGVLLIFLPRGVVYLGLFPLLARTP